MATSISRPKKYKLLFTAALLAILGFLPMQFGRLRHPKPLWPGARYTDVDRDVAVERGLLFIGGIASNPKYFSRWGHDLLWCLYTISNTAKNPQLRKMAYRLGQERAREWRRAHVEPATDNPDELFLFVYGADGADRLLGVGDPSLKGRLQEIAQRFSAVDFFEFDPKREPPPTDLPEACPKCGHRNPRGATNCRKCNAPLNFQNRYAVWLDALVIAHSGDSYGVTLGASYPEVLHWISAMRPYPSPANSDEDEFNRVSYAVTHVVYTLNDYGKYRLSPAWLPQEFAYLKTNIGAAAEYENGEMLGEFMDSLRAFGRSEADPEIRAAVEYLLSHQNPDGSWGDKDEEDIYTRYHSTWTAVDGLREYSFQGEQLRLPDLLPLLRGAASDGSQSKTIKLYVKK